MTERRPEAPDLLDVQADLQISVDGVDVRLVGEGRHLRLVTDHPLRLLRSVAASGGAVPGGRAALTKAVDAASDRGLTLVASGPRGPSVRVGADVSSTLGRRVVGSPHVQLVTTRAQQITVGAVVAAAVVAWIAARRR